MQQIAISCLAVTASSVTTGQTADDARMAILVDLRRRAKTVGISSAASNELGRNRRAGRRHPAMATDRIRIDPSVVRGLEYYTGPVYEVELTARDQGRKRPPRALRLGRRRRALRWPGLALSRRAGAGDRIFHRRVAAAGRAHDARQARHHAGIRSRGRHRVRPRPRRRLPEDGRGACATPTSAPSSISAIPRTWATSSNMPTAATRPA